MRLNKVLFTGFLLPFLGLAGCGEADMAGPDGNEGAYFDVPAFINGQISELNQLQAGLTKTVWLDHQKPETQQLKPDNWQHELEYFQEIDLNKKAFAGLYKVTEQNLPSGRRLVYTLKPEENAHLRQVEIITDRQNQPVHLRAIQETNNALFFSREVRDLQTNSQGLFRQYRISGVQKVILFDSLHYATEVNLKKLF